MKKNWFKRTLGIGLALILAVGLCACGTGDGDEEGNGGGGSGKKNRGNANSALAKENVYKINEIAFPQLVEEGEGYVNVNETIHKDGKIYALLQIQDWTSGDTDMKLLSMNEDGSDMQLVALELSGQEESDSDVSGTAKLGADVSPLETAAADFVEEETNSNIWEYTSYNYFTISPDGTIYGTRDYYYEDYTNPEEYVSEQHQYLCSWNTDGSFLWEVELEGLRSSEEEWVYLRDIFAAEDGSLNLLLAGDNAYKMNVSKDGVVSDRVKLSDETTAVLNSYQYLMQKEDGSFLVMYNDQDDWTKSYLADYDFEADTLGEPVELPSAFTWNGFQTMAAGASSDIVYTNNTGVYTYNKGDAQGTLRMNFVNSDVNITGFSGFVELDDKHFVALYNENYEDKLKAAVFTYVEPEEIADKVVLVLAGNYIGSDMKQRVIEYNRANDEYRIVIKSYDSYNSYDDYNAGYTQLNNDIITGGMPDILLADGLPVDNYIAKGLLADVNKLIEKDEELSQIEFMQNVFDAYSADGKLYYVIPRFSVVTMVAKTSLVGDGSDWSMEKMQQVLSDMGEGTQAIGEVTRDGFMSMAMQFCGRDFIDLETGKCAFDSEDFIAMMEFAKTLPEEIDWDKLGDDYWSSYESQYRDNRTLLMQMYMSSFDNLSYQLNGYLGEDFTFVGFPTENGGGAYINAYDSLVLSAKSDNLDGAWDFVRYYLTDEYQENIDWGLPINKRIFMEQSVKATKRPTYEDYETKEEVEYDQTIYINGEEVVIPPLSQEQLDQVIAYIESVNMSYYYSEDVLNIINEEMGAFYSGQKTARDTAAIIQSRIQLYVDENR